MAVGSSCLPTAVSSPILDGAEVTDCASLERDEEREWMEDDEVVLVRSVA